MFTSNVSPNFNTVNLKAYFKSGTLKQISFCKKNLLFNKMFLKVLITIIKLSIVTSESTQGFLTNTIHNMQSLAPES